jgi:uncharacterized protein (DUF2344 family)
MKRIKEEFSKKSEETVEEGSGKNKKEKKVITITRQLVHEEDFILSIEEIERMEKNSNAIIEKANYEIEIANQKLEECKKLREML